MHGLQKAPYEEYWDTMGLPRELRAKDMNKKLEFVRSLRDDDPSYYEPEVTQPESTAKPGAPNASQLAQLFSPKVTVYNNDHPDHQKSHAEKRAALFAGEPDILEVIARGDAPISTSDSPR